MSAIVDTITMYKLVISAVGGILSLLIIGMVLSAIPDPNRLVVNSLPNTTPDVKSVANTALDVKDIQDQYQQTTSWVWSFDKLLLVVGVPSAIIGGLVLRAFR